MKALKEETEVSVVYRSIKITRKYKVLKIYPDFENVTNKQV